LQDTSSDIRKVASGGWRKALSIPEEVIPVLVEALRDAEVQVRANAAHALARLDSLPAEAIPLLIACMADPNDGLRMNAGLGLEGEELRDALSRLIGRLGKQARSDVQPAAG